MEINTPENLLRQCDHLLDGIEENHGHIEEIKKEINNLRSEIRGLLHLNNMGYALTVDAGMTKLDSHLGELIQMIGERPTDPGTPPEV